MEAQAYIKQIHISPKKLRFAIGDIKKKTPQVALNTLFTSQKRTDKILYKVLQSAVSNAKQLFKTDGADLKFKTFLVEEGQVLKRMRPGSKGMANMYKRRTSHVKVVLINTPPIKKNASITKKIEIKKDQPALESKTEIKKEKLKVREKKKTLPKVSESKK